MNDLQANTFDYLTSGGGDLHERKRVLRLLVDGGYLSADVSEDETKEGLLGFLDRNPTGACDGGIARFKEALGLVDPAKTVTMQVIFNIEFTDIEDGPLSGLGDRSIQKMAEISQRIQGHTNDYGMIGHLTSLLRAQPWIAAASYQDYYIDAPRVPPTRIAHPE